VCGRALFERGSRDVGRETRLTPRASRRRSDVESSGGSPLIRIARHTGWRCHQGSMSSRRQVPSEERSSEVPDFNLPVLVADRRLVMAASHGVVEFLGRGKPPSEAASVRRVTPGL
jgi:hypothetical protein